MNLLWLDVETTGLSPKRNSVIELGSIVDIDQTVKRQIHLVSRPVERRNRVDDKALQTNNFDINAIYNFPKSSTAVDLVIQSLSPFVKSANDRFIIAGWCVQFDYHFIYEMFRREGREAEFSSLFTRHLLDVSTLSIMFKINGYIKIKNNKLTTIAEALDITIDSPHRAMSDITATREVYYTLLKKITFGGGL